MTTKVYGIIELILIPPLLCGVFLVCLLQYYVVLFFDSSKYSTHKKKEEV